MKMWCYFLIFKNLVSWEMFEDCGNQEIDEITNFGLWYWNDEFW